MKIIDQKSRTTHNFEINKVSKKLNPERFKIEGRSEKGSLVIVIISLEELKKITNQP